MLIVQKHSIWGTDYVLCDEVRRTEKRVYVRFVAGRYVALSGSREKGYYVDIDNILTENGTADMLKALEVASDAYQENMAAISSAAAKESREAKARHTAIIDRIVQEWK